ncbi:DNA methyltransferase [Thalassovita taeanensis]|uniref:site-specific DNA-methyltransferase (adenine-specific) n=1 Tax=Thalassovita taeanensis TaxID=657014 RepID=A0A1H9KEE5_9RHOB|nr:DNA methyltransferase [Thalassovita taeanensis]SEQ97305.1 DNA methylase [Thalassovita taeanensis]
MTEQMKMDGGKNGGPVECLGMTFASDDARREHFQKLLAEKLQDPVFRAQEGFPKGTDDAILTMSDPPYYTACPNPWLAEFVTQYGRPYDPAEKYSREPMAIDVSEGKTDPIYKAHSYHTKVPHLAIVPSILHYTEPGDIVLDGFSGSGMTGVAAQWCGTAPSTYRHKIEMEWKKAGNSLPKWGPRRVVLNDLSPAATFIGANYNLPFDVDDFAKAGKQLLLDVEREIGWMYETLHSDGKTKGRIEFTVWSEIFTCPECAGEVNFVAEALDENKSVRSVFPCPHCGSELTKKTLERREENKVDSATGATVVFTKRAPSLICYKVDGVRYEKQPDEADFERLKKIENLPFPKGVPTDRMMHAPDTRQNWGDKWRAGSASFSHVHHLFLSRPQQVIGHLWLSASSNNDPRTRMMLLWFVEQAIWGMTMLARYVPTHFSQVNQYLNGVYYLSSQHAECSPWYILDGKLKRLGKAFSEYKTYSNSAAITTGTTTSLPLLDRSIDYIFTDPPFGDNLAYSELNFLLEAFHGVVTDQAPEAVMSKAQSKGLVDYHHLMKSCFAEYYRVLKPGRWMTVVFSNTKASVWNSLQTALQEAGFVVANVSALDKKQGSFNAVTTAVAVKQDLAISVYKPDEALERRFEKQVGVESVWDFIESHLRQLPVAKQRLATLEYIVERDPRILFDRMVAWFVRHNAPVPLSSQEFQEGLRNRFLERDGMTFLPEQVAEYDRKRAQTEQAPQMELFVSDERSAIDWLTDFLKKRPSTYQELNPEFMTQLGAGWKKHEMRPELSALLEDNFLRFDGNGDVPSQIHSYLSTNFKDLRGLEKEDPRLKAKARDRWFVPDPNKAKDLEQKRERLLLKEFEAYKAATKRQMKESRLEVLRAGFKTAWGAKDYKTIISIAEKLPDETLQEDEKLLLWYDQALTRTEADA